MKEENASRSKKYFCCLCCCCCYCFLLVFFAWFLLLLKLFFKHPVNLADLKYQKYDILTEFNLRVENVKLTYQMLNHKINKKVRLSK